MGFPPKARCFVLAGSPGCQTGSHQNELKVSVCSFRFSQLARLFIDVLFADTGTAKSTSSCDRRSALVGVAPPLSVSFVRLVFAGGQRYAERPFGRGMPLLQYKWFDTIHA